MENSNKTYAVIGSGSWGTALAILLASNNHKVFLWGRNETDIANMLQARENSKYLPGITLPDLLTPVSSLAEAVKSADEVLVVVPSRAVETILNQLQPIMPDNAGIVWASKGLEEKSCRLIHELVFNVFGEKRRHAVVSGPTFAREVALGLPTAVTVASNDDSYANQLAVDLHNDTFRAYTCTDIIGVEIGGAVKNILAIAAGIADGLKFGANTRAALITRGLAEITRLGLSRGARAETFMGLAGLGDLVLTCTDNQSRNRRLGIGLAAGKDIDSVLAELGQVAEGLYTADVIFRLAKSIPVEMPICEEVYNILYQNKDPRQAVYSLLHRSIKSEV